MEQNTPLIPTSAEGWASKASMEGHDLALPSGNVARVRTITPTTFITSGLIPDPLTDIIRRAIHTHKGLNPKDLEKISEDPELFASALQMFDQVLVRACVMPVVKMPPPCDVAVEDGSCGLYAIEEVHKTPTRNGHHEYNEGLREPGVLYADIVDMDDKVFIFQWCMGGTNDLATFRQEQQRSLDALQNGDDVPLPPV